MSPLPRRSPPLLTSSPLYFRSRVANCSPLSCAGRNEANREFERPRKWPALSFNEPRPPSTRTPLPPSTGPRFVYKQAKVGGNRAAFSDLCVKKDRGEGVGRATSSLPTVLTALLTPPGQWNSIAKYSIRESSCRARCVRTCLLFVYCIDI